MYLSNVWQDNPRQNFLLVLTNTFFLSHTVKFFPVNIRMTTQIEYKKKHLERIMIFQFLDLIVGISFSQKKSPINSFSGKYLKLLRLAACSLEDVV